MSKADVADEINRQLAAKRFPSALIAYWYILDKREREHGF
ncbi:hypothetical protein ACVIN2_004851 [Bradyrhizobium sp. USDA 3650]